MDKIRIIDILKSHILHPQLLAIYAFGSRIQGNGTGACADASYPHSADARRRLVDGTAVGRQGYGAAGIDLMRQPEVFSCRRAA